MHRPDLCEDVPRLPWSIWNPGTLDLRQLEPGGVPTEHVRAATSLELPARPVLAVLGTRPHWAPGLPDWDPGPSCGFLGICGLSSVLSPRKPGVPTCPGWLRSSRSVMESGTSSPDDEGGRWPQNRSLFIRRPPVSRLGQVPPAARASTWTCSRLSKASWAGDWTE